MTDQTTTRQIKINVPGTATTKAEEIETLQKIVSALSGTGSYLESLLRPAVLQWFKENVECDFAPDLWSQIEFERQSSAELNRAARDEISDLKRQIASHETGSEILRRQIEQAEERIQHAEDRHRRELEEYRIRAQEAEAWGNNESNLRYAAETALQNKEVEVGVLNDQIIRLKAKLFDLMTA